MTRRRDIGFVAATRESTTTLLQARYFMPNRWGPHVPIHAALVALGRLDREHAAVYFQVIWNALREPMQRALEALVMERQAEGETKFPPFA